MEGLVMPANPQDNGFTETAEMPRGRKARIVPDAVLAKLEDSATRGVAFAKSATPAEIDELRKDLGAASVKAKYVVTFETKKVSDTVHELKFSAVRQPDEVAVPETASA
jgi:hypothetical protein